MASLNLDFDEGILLSGEDVIWVSRDFEYLDDFLLTNKRLYCTYEKSNGLFKKPTEETCILSLSDIKMLNGQPLVQQVKHEGRHCLQIQFVQGTEYFSFSRSPKKVIPQWISEIRRTLGAAEASPVAPVERDDNPLTSAFTEVANNFKTVIDTAAGTFGVSAGMMGTVPAPSAKNATDGIETTQDHCQDDSTVCAPNFCPNCGRKLTPDTRFCPGCGQKVAPDQDDRKPAGKEESRGTSSSDVVEHQKSETSTPIQETRSTAFSSQRKQEYVGVIHKCPNCGNVVNPTDTVCESCGFHLSGKEAIYSARDFQQKLLEIEMTRKEKKLGFWNQREFYALDATDKQVIALIQSYPIPNSIEDIVDFFFLALGNIDVEKSKKSFVNSDSWDGGNRERTISNTWVGKMKQLYRKAKLLFPNEPEFAQIEEAYLSMMEELKLQ